VVLTFDALSARKCEAQTARRSMRGAFIFALRLSHDVVYSLPWRHAFRGLGKTSLPFFDMFRFSYARLSKRH